MPDRKPEPTDPTKKATDAAERLTRKDGGNISSDLMDDIDAYVESLQKKPGQGAPPVK